MAYAGNQTGAQVDEALRKALLLPEIKGEVLNFTALPAGTAGDIYFVIDAEGIWLLNRKPSGWYRYSGTAWDYKGVSMSSLTSDANFEIRDDGDATKIVKFQASGITTGNTRIMSIPDKNILIADDADIPVTTVDFDPVGTDNSTDVILTGTPNYITIVGQVITRALINLTSHVTGVLPVANGGTNSATASGARTSLGVAIGSDVQAFDADNAVRDVAAEWTKTQNFNGTVLTDATSVAWDMSANQVCKVTLGGNRTMALPTNIVDGAHYTLKVIQDATGSRTLAYNAAFLFPGGTAPTLSTAANSIDMIHLVGHGTTQLLCTSALAFS